MNFRRLLFSSSVAFSLCALAACGSSPSDDNRGFYTWVDAQGNLVTVQRDKADTSGVREGQAADVAAPSSSLPSDALLAAKVSDVQEPASAEDMVTADNPVALWEAGDDAYVSEEEIAARLEARERERFISYPDEEGRIVTHALDMKAVKAAGASRDPGYETLVQDTGAFVEGTVQLQADCCTSALEQASDLVVGEEVRLRFTGKAVPAIHVDGVRPAMMFRLMPGVTGIEVQSWLREQGYMHPRILFLDQAGKPVLLIDSPFSRRYPESFFAWPSLFGEVTVPEQAASVAVYLPYAVAEEGRTFVSTEAMPGSEPGMELRLQGDAVIRAR